MAFGAKIYVYDPYKKIKSKSITKIKKLENFLKKIDILSVHIHLTKKNKNFINKNKKISFIFGYKKVWDYEKRN